MNYNSLLPLEYFFSPQVRAKQTFSSRGWFGGWNIPLSTAKRGTAVIPWYDQVLYTDLDRALDEEGPSIGDYSDQWWNATGAISAGVLQETHPYEGILIEIGMKRVFPGMFIMYEELPAWLR